MDMSGWGLTDVAAIIIYVVLGLIALWGAFCTIMVWRRVAEKRFASEDLQSEFLDEVEEALAKGDFDDAGECCQDDPRAVPQLALLAITNRKVGYAKVRQLMLDRFQSDVLSDLEYRLSWIYTVIKTAPMAGLLGTVVGMMGAFGKLKTEAKVMPDQLAGDIMVALITTACGLAIAIPLVLCTASINVRIRKMEALVSLGVTRFLECFRAALGKSTGKEG